MSVIVAAMLGLGLASPALPEPREAPPPVMRIAYSHAELATPQGRDRVRNRLDAAARDFCAAHRTVVTPQHVRSGNYCEQTMRAAALRELPLSVRRQLRAAD